MATQAELDAALKAARAWVDREAGFYAGMITDSDLQKLCQIVLDAASGVHSDNAGKGEMK